jgi:L-lactate permease
VRIKAIMVGAIAALALATLTANAGTTASPGVSGSLVSLVAATTTVSKTAERDSVTVAMRSTESEKTAEPAEKPVVAVKTVAPRAPQTAAACLQAINTLKAMHQADVTEDAAERAATARQPLSALALAADRTEDLAEAQRWSQALTATRTACQPQPTPVCQSALTSLKALLPVWRPEEWSDLVKLPTQVDLTAVRAAVTAVATACGQRD